MVGVRNPGPTLGLRNIAGRRHSRHSRGSRYGWGYRCCRHSSRCRWGWRGYRRALDRAGVDRCTTIGARSRTDHHRSRISSVATGAAGLDYRCSTAAASVTTGAASRCWGRGAVRNGSTRALRSPTSTNLVEQTTTTAILSNRAATSSLLRMQAREQPAPSASASIVSTATGHRNRSETRCHKRNGCQNYHSKLTHRNSSREN